MTEERKMLTKDEYELARREWINSLIELEVAVRYHYPELPLDANTKEVLARTEKTWKTYINAGLDY